MATIRREIYSLVGPTALCFAAMGILGLRNPSSIHAQPLARVQVVQEVRAKQRPPSPERSVIADETTEEAHTHTDVESIETAGTSHHSVMDSTLTVTGEVATSEWVSVIELGDDDGRPSEWMDWALYDSRMSYYARRAWAERRARFMSERARRVRSWLSLSNAPLGSLSEREPVDVCSVFASVCGSQNSRETETNPSENPSDSSPEIHRRGQVWKLANERVSLSIDPSALCAVTFAQRNRADVSLVFATEGSVSCTVEETLAPETNLHHNTVALLVTWTAGTYTQQAVISLSDDERGPEMSLARTTPHDVTLINLTASPLLWTVANHEVLVSSADTVVLPSQQ
jgi:hypothetical protein